MALILVHHTRKNTESENSFDRISGTNGLLGAADGAFLLYREKGRVILDQTGKDLPGQRMILDFDPQRCLWTVVALFVYLVCCQIPLYGITNASSSDPLYWIRAIMASNRCVVDVIGQYVEVPSWNWESVPS